MLIIVCMAVIRVCMYYILSQVKVKKEFLWINQINWRNKKPLNFTKNFQPKESFTFTEARKQNTHTHTKLPLFLFANWKKLFSSHVWHSRFTCKLNHYGPKQCIRKLQAEACLPEMTWKAWVISQAVRKELHERHLWWWQMKECYHTLGSTHQPGQNQ